MRLQDIMTTPVETALPGEPAALAWERMRAKRIRHLVVRDGRRIVGIISDRDLGGPRGGVLRKDATVADLMAPSAVTAHPDDTVRKAANLLRGHTIGCLPVVEGSRLVGIVTVSDLLDLIGQGTERPVEIGKRWTLKHRGPRRARGTLP